MKSFAIIGAPFNRLGHYITKKNTVTPIRKSNKNRWNGLTEWINIRNQRWNADIVDLGDVKVDRTINKLLKRKKSLLALKQYSKRLKRKVLEVLHDNRIPITIGGDHSISIGTISAIIDFYQIQKSDKVCIIWIDAHADCNNSNSNNLHGKPLAILMNEYKEWVLNSGECLSPDNLIYIGLRDLMPNELEIINRNSITNYSIKDIDEMGLNNIIKSIEDKMINYDKFYISFDYDSLDGSIYNHCATPNIGGLTSREVLNITNKLTQHSKFVGMDICEYLPEKDKKKISKELIVKIIDTTFGFRI